MNSEEPLSDSLRQLWTVLEDLSADKSVDESPDESPDGKKDESVFERLESPEYLGRKQPQGVISPGSDGDGALRSGINEIKTPIEILDSKPVTINHISRDLRYLFVSQSYAQWLGIDPKDLVGRHISEILPEEIYQTSLPYIQRALSGEVVAFSLAIPEGDRLWYKDITLIPQFEEESDLAVAYFAAIKDVTDHRLAEEELRRSKMELEDRVAWRTMELKAANEALKRSRDYLDMIINSISDPIFVMDREHRLVLVNDAFCSIMALPKEEILGKVAYDFSFPRQIADDYWQRNEDVFINCRENVVEENQGHFPDTSATVLVKRIPINDSDENRLLVGIIRDITDIKRAQEKIRFQADLLEQVHNTVIAVDLKGNIIYWNKFAETLLGWKAEEISGKNIADTLVPEWGLERMKNVISELIRDCRGCDGEFYFKTKDKSMLPFHQCFSSIKNEQGELVGLVGVAVDLTERKQVEEALKKAKMDAEDAASAKSNFLANMSHEIRTPLNAIIGMTSILLEETLTPEQKDCIEVIATNGDALLTVINDILDFSKMESNCAVLEDYPFDLWQCIEESLDLVGINAAMKGINLAYTIDKNVPKRIMGDPGRLRQVLGNLFSNAVKFTDFGEVVVSVSGQEIDGSNEIHFVVQDTGIGIPEDHMKLLFQPFSQMELSTTRLYGGTGLGLAISMKLVEMMNGRIWAESEEGEGSRFHFTIKAHAFESEPEPLVVSPEITDRRVLIALNNKTNRRILSKQIYDWGMLPMLASSGQEALLYIQRGESFDIAIVDMDLEDMDGQKLAESIKKCARDLPVLLLTSLGRQAPSGYVYLTKPLKPTQLHKALIDILPGRWAKTESMKPGRRKASPISPLRILLAEDNISSQKVAQEMLRRLGYRADVACNGLEALQTLEQDDFDIVLMDLRMPELDGLEATRIIRQRWPKRRMKIIALTAHALPGDRERCLEAGMDGYISKPLRKEELARELEKHKKN